MSENDYTARAKNVLRAELTRKGVSVKQLAEMLEENERVLANKISRGKFTAAFMFRCLDVIGVSEVRV